MEEFVKQLIENPWFLAIGYAIAILGFPLGVIGIYLTIRSLKDKKPRYAVKSNNLIQGLSREYDKLKVTYDGQEIENITVSKVYFWNAGRETIRAEDVATLSPVEILLLGGKILDTRLLSEPGTNKFETHLSPDAVKCAVSFEYMDHRDVAIIQLVHTSASEGSISMSGTIKGAKSAIREINLFKRFDRIMMSSGVGLAVIFGTLMITFSDLLVKASFGEFLLRLLIGVIGFIVAFGLLGGLLTSLFVKFPKNVKYE